MTAYKVTDIHNNLVHENAEEALLSDLLDDATYTKIVEAYPVQLYTPNYFIRFGLGLLTLIAGLFLSFLLGLMSGVSNNGSISVFLFFMVAICYVALELLVNAKMYYNAGIDNVLMALIVIFLLAACFFVNMENPYVLGSALTCIICLWLAYRFVDGFCAAIAWLFFYFYIFFFFSRLGDAAQITTPFVLMAVSAIVYFLAKKAGDNKAVLYHKFCLECIMVTCVVCFYASCNYYVIKEMLNGNFANFPTRVNLPMAPGWVFWLFTIVIPPAYLVYGTAKKSLLFMRAGVLFIATTILTIRYYHSFLPVDIALILAGSLLIIVSYALIKYLRTPKNGFSFSSPLGDDSLRNAEALVAVQTFGGVHHNSAQQGVEFGGGSSGGGGADGSF